MKLEYAGPKTRLEVDIEGWQMGKKLGGGHGHQTMRTPLSGEAAFGFGEGSNPEGKTLVTVTESLPVESDPATGSVSGRTGSVQQYGVPPLKDRVCRTFEPAWPLEVNDGKEAIFWAVFVDESQGVAPATSLEERARGACLAWLFRIRTAVEKLKPPAEK